MSTPVRRLRLKQKFWVQWAGGGADGDGDANGEEADAEAKLLEAVDAGEANSTSSGGKRRGDG